mgnify:CR=1 FL=1|jgi:hypothetical protein|tara:strand:- start:2260 stop:2838 length:579 start_codon:yes stop_codon:yes gene_type:complete
MKLFKYENYDHYLKAQTDANKRKLNNVWVDSKVINSIARLKGEAHTILCHGTRNGAEQKMFQKCYPNAEVLGTEISDTAKSFPLTTQWDFTHSKGEWESYWDIVYSNAFDHSMSPEETLITWRNQLSVNGRLYIDYTYQAKHALSHASDPLVVYKNEMVPLLEGLGLELVSVNPMQQKRSTDSVIYEAKRKQ